MYKMKLYQHFIRFIFVLALSASCVNISAQQLPKDSKLTIDEPLQKLGERLLQNKQGSIVAIEPSTGRILALVSKDKLNDGINRAISETYSPGSTFKVAQALEMLTEGTLSPEVTYPCDEGFTFNDIRIGCHEHHSPLSLVQAIGQSCNSYFCKAFQEMIDNRKAYSTKFKAINRWDAYMKSMGLGSPLGIDLPGEKGGAIPDSAFLQNTHRSWNGTTIMWVGMGQGEVEVTPLQLCNLAALIGNRGYFYTPHIYEKNDVAKDFTKRRLCMASPYAFDIVIEGMRAAIENGTAESINSDEYDICGKTGTAENSGEDHSIFMGFAPMTNPQIAISVYVENGGFGAVLSAPLAALMIEQYLNGSLSEKSEHKATKWEKKKVKITSVEVPLNLDDL